MSAYHEYEVAFTDLKALLKALQAMKSRNGAQFTEAMIEVHEEPANLHGFRGDVRPQKANVIIRRQNVGAAANDIGFEKRADGKYVAHVSSYDSSYYNAEWMNRLKQEYAFASVEAKAKANGYTVQRTEAKGKIQAKLVKWTG